MRLALLAVGHRMPDWIDAGVAEYQRRMPPDWPLALTAVKPGLRAAGEDGERARRQESERLLAALPPGSVPVALDERGKMLTTRGLADWLGTLAAAGTSPAFLIGGADGLDAGLKARAVHTLSLSALTLPHALARLVLVEQLYRAVCILKNHPYHRD